MGKRSKGCGSTVRAMERARAKIESVLLWARVRRRGENAIFFMCEKRGGCVRLRRDFLGS